MRLGTIIADRLARNSSVPKPPDEDRLNNQNEKKRKQKREHCAERLVLEDV
jgi:hypothetical protein